MSWTPQDIPDLTGRRAVVTGSNAGLGLRIATGLAAHGAEVVLACRSVDRAEAAARSIEAKVPGASVSTGHLDLADLDSVQAFAAALPGDRLDLLVNNAGLMAVDEARTAQGFELQFGVNHLGHFALTGLLLPRLLATPGSRVGAMSSIGHRRARLTDGRPVAWAERRGQAYDRWQAYFASKLANLWFTAALQRRLATAGAAAVAVTAHPGISHTDLGTEGTSAANRLMPYVVPLLGQTVEHGARPMLRALTDPGVRGGEYFGPRFRARGRTPVRETPSRAARDDDAAERLWDESARMVGFDPADALRAPDPAS